ncbi:uncharacterized protein BCR38DRAFT_427065 [Pseudomassariella vexata]|uniref:Uncharacterized protein n=1 Tax=Pseudomassariella vexata TaxID=1141098 RepID=A0A1Y2E790_9PEZI|nr:uncharacterized protein BCR38DRAFT_427065 [Pseudomassariella vexata]ORY67443.1 hypothetical protein BCR38DRAFT_427065 [Pseudomassariella vexata]
MAETSLALKIAISLLMVDSLIELSFVSSMVGWVHRTASKGFEFNYNGATYPLAGTPSNFLVDQGHTSNGAAGTAFVLIGLGGILSLRLRSRSNSRSKSGSNIPYYLWIALNIPALLLTLGALAFTFAVTNAHRGQIIDVELASRLDGSPYPENTWTPQNWFPAVLQLDLVAGRSDIESILHLMRGWQYNLIPFSIIQLAETVLAVADLMSWRKGGYAVAKQNEGT